MNRRCFHLRPPPGRTAPLPDRAGRCSGDQVVNRSSTRATCVGDHVPPRAVSMPPSLSPAAMARGDVAPLGCSSSMDWLNVDRPRRAAGGLTPLP